MQIHPTIQKSTNSQSHVSLSGVQCADHHTSAKQGLLIYAGIQRRGVLRRCVEEKSEQDHQNIGKGQRKDLNAVALRIAGIRKARVYSERGGQG